MWCCGSCGSECVTGKCIVSKPTSNQQFHTHKQFEAQQPAHRVSPAHANAHARTNAHVHAAATVEREAAAQFEVVAHDAAVERETAALSAAIGDPVSNSSDESKLCIFESVLVVHYMGAHSVKPEGNGSQAVGITGHVVLHPAMVGCSTTCNVDGPLMNR